MVKSSTDTLLTTDPRSRVRTMCARLRAIWTLPLTISASTPYPLLVIALIVSLLLNLGMGAVSVAPDQVITILGTHLRAIVTDLPGWGVVVDLPGTGMARSLARAFAGTDLYAWITADATRQQDAVVWTIRLPRLLMGCIAGAGLAVSGAALQGIFRNPLADPGLIGVSSGAALGAVVATVLSIGIWGIWTLPIFAFVGAISVTATVYLIARHEGKTEVVTLLLAGVALNAVIGAGVGLLITYANDQQIRSITFWTMGSLGGTLWEQVGIVFVVTTIGLAIIGRFAMPLNLLVLGEREARHLGVRVERTRGLIMFTTAAMTGASVAFTGSIGFVGLVVPHLVRLWLGPDHRRLLPCSALLGATLMLLADLVSRTVVAPLELPIGVVTSFIGGPFFIWLLLKTRRQQGGWA